MSKLCVLAFLLGLLACAAALPTASTNSTINETENPIATLLSQSLVQTLTQKLASLVRITSLKLRVARFVAGLYTNENLVLFRDLIEHGISVANFTLTVLPKTVDDPRYTWLLPISQLIVGIGGSIDSSGGVDLTSTTPPPPEHELPEEVLAVDPPVIFNAPNTVRYTRNTDKPIETDPVVSENEVHNIQGDVISQYRARLSALHRVINAKK